MKNTALIILLLVGVCSLPGIAQDTAFLDAASKLTTRDQAQFIRNKFKTDSGWLVKYYYMTGILASTELFQDDSLQVRQGTVTSYDDKAQISHTVHYNNGKKEGRECYYYNDGKLQVEGDNQAGKPQGEWKGYYRTGQLSGKAVYDTGRQASACFFEEDGKPRNHVDSFLKESSFPGGMRPLYQFLGHTTKYPNAAVRKNIQGTVIVEFKVLANGKVSDITVVRSVERTLDKEALRVVGLMPDWEPAILGGLPCDSYKKLPFVFRF